ncbi:hypothetical protein JCM10212_003757 [Sporobolomyces blumeae]
MSPSPQALSLPRWVDSLRSTLTKNLKENKDLISYALATVDDQHRPRTRFVVHRGFVNERRKDSDGSSNKVKDDQDNDLISDKLVVTTDARTPKSVQMAANPAVEIAWWLAATQHQYRIVGKAYILASPAFAKASDSPKFPFPADELSPYPGFNWEDERIRQFRKLSPELRASFVRPIPGTKLSEWDGKMEDLPEKLVEGYDEAKSDDEKKQLDEALRNFALIVIDPTEVDLVDLGSMPNERTQWFRSGSKWEEQGVVP